MVDYKKKKILTINQFTYEDGQILYDVEYSRSHSKGMLSETEVIIETLVAMGKIDEPVVYVTPLATNSNK